MFLEGCSVVCGDSSTTSGVAMLLLYNQITKNRFLHYLTMHMYMYVYYTAGAFSLAAINTDMNECEGQLNR